MEENVIITDKSVPEVQIEYDKMLQPSSSDVLFTNESVPWVPIKCDTMLEFSSSEERTKYPKYRSIVPWVPIECYTMLELRTSEKWKIMSLLQTKAYIGYQTMLHYVRAQHR